MIAYILAGVAVVGLCVLAAFGYRREVTAAEAERYNDL
jgi:hypothetical protein